MKQYFGYIRVSSVRQGVQGVSLPQQREAIERHAQRHNLEISRWFEEQETAAKQGRAVFNEMMKLLRCRSAAGVIIHKIDRSARNLRDWADLGELIDQGIEVHFANEALDLNSRGGRLSADIQAVVAADYIRNLREEAKKGFYGRLKQGYFPMPAPWGYLDKGQAKPKVPDPAMAPLVRRAFELYGTGRYNLLSLALELQKLGLRRPNGQPIRRNRLSEMLNNPFYFGLIHIRKTGQYFTGVHDPIISKKLFDQVQAVLQGKLNTRSQKHDFLFRRRLTCKGCDYSLVGETHKGYIYYRCQIHDCPTTSVREEIVDSAVRQRFSFLRFSPDECRYLRQQMLVMRSEQGHQQEQAVQALQLRLSGIDDRVGRLTDAYIDRLIDKELFEERKAALLLERRDVDDQLTDWMGGKRNVAEELAKFLERADSAYLAYKQGILLEKRQLLDSLTSNRLVEGKTPIITLAFPFEELANRFENQGGGASRDIPRTWNALLPRLLSLIVQREPASATT
jgi:site-specific DNA recombinase